MRLTPQQRHANETRIRKAMNRLLSGQVPPGGRCDIKTLARESGIDRTAFYGTRPYTRLREEFEARLSGLRHAGELPDPRDAQITRLKNEIGTLNQRITRRDEKIADLSAFKTAALSRIAAQHDEITHLRQHVAPSNVRRLPSPGTSS